METTGTTRPLRLVATDGEPTSGAPRPSDECAQLSTEDYWARVQALRDDLARLRRAN